MISKVFEIRDSGTCIAVLAIRMLADRSDNVLGYWLRRCGYPEDGSSIMLMLLYDGRATNDPYDWGKFNMGSRTLPNAHNYIIDNFDALDNGAVVDVQVILGETTEPKVSERLAIR